MSTNIQTVIGIDPEDSTPKKNLMLKVFRPLVVVMTIAGEPIKDFKSFVAGYNGFTVF